MIKNQDMPPTFQDYETERNTMLAFDNNHSLSPLLEQASIYALRDRCGATDARRGVDPYVGADAAYRFIEPPPRTEDDVADRRAVRTHWKLHVQSVRRWLFAHLCSAR